MKIYPDFCVSVLIPYKEADANGPNFRRPPPDIIERREEFEVQEICGVHRLGKENNGNILSNGKTTLTQRIHGNL
jgi:hypothetical protein